MDVSGCQRGTAASLGHLRSGDLCRRFWSRCVHGRWEGSGCRVLCASGGPIPTCGGLAGSHMKGSSASPIHLATGAVPRAVSVWRGLFQESSSSRAWRVLQPQDAPPADRLVSLPCFSFVSSLSSSPFLISCSFCLCLRCCLSPHLPDPRPGCLLFLFPCLWFSPCLSWSLGISAGLLFTSKCWFPPPPSVSPFVSLHLLSLGLHTPLHVFYLSFPSSLLCPASGKRAEITGQDWMSLNAQKEKGFLFSCCPGERLAMRNTLLGNR